MRNCVKPKESFMRNYVKPTASSFSPCSFVAIFVSILFSQIQQSSERVQSTQPKISAFLPSLGFNFGCWYLSITVYVPLYPSFPKKRFTLQLVKSDYSVATIPQNMALYVNIYAIVEAAVANIDYFLFYIG